jgi:hypothetical protein
MTLRTLSLSALTTGLLALATQASASMAIQPVLTFYTSEATFTSANPGLGFESFESVASRTRASTAVTVPGLSVTPLGTALLGVQTGPDAPEAGYGTGATHGSRYLFSWLPGQPSGTLRFDFQTPTLAFGLNLTDLGEVTGEIRLDTNNSGLPASTVVYTFGSSNLPGNGSVLFAGVSQDTPFSSDTLTITGVDEAYGVDKVYVQSVPEPGEWAMMLAGLVPLVGIARRRRTAAQR